MNKKWKKSVQRFFALFLCVAMLLPMFPQVVRAEGNVTGVVLDAGVAAGGSLAATVETGSKAIKLTRVKNSLIQDSNIAMMSNAYGYIMSYDPIGTTSGPNKADSLRENEHGSSENTYYTDASGNVYIDHSDRDNALWVMHQDLQVTNNSTIASGKPIQASNNGGGQYSYFGYDYTNSWPIDYRNHPGILFHKGTKSNPGNIYVAGVGSFWSSTGKYDASNTNNTNNTEYRFLCARSDSQWFKDGYEMFGTSGQASGGNPIVSRYRMERIEEKDANGNATGEYTYLIYYYNSNKDFRVLYCDAYGNWGVKRYQSSASTDSAAFEEIQNAVHDNLEMHKLRLYSYSEESTTKSVTISGYDTYVLDSAKSWTQDQVLDYILDNTIVMDAARKGQRIAYSESGSKVGYYHITKPSGATGTYTIYYTDDAGTQKVLGKVTVSTAAVGTELSSTTGITSLNSPFKYEVMEAAEENGEFVPTQDKVTFTFGTLTVPVTISMLTTSNGAQFSTKTADQTTGTEVTVKFSGKTIGTMTMYVADATLKQQLPQYPAAGSVYSYKGTDTTQKLFNDNGTATIQLSTAATPDTTPIDLIIMVDLSSSMRYQMERAYEGEKLTYRDPYASEDGTRKQEGTAAYNTWFAAWQGTRMYAMEQSLQNMIKSLQATGMDINVAVSDFGDLDHYEFPDARLSDDYARWPFVDTDSNNENNISNEFANHLNFVLGRDNRTDFAAQYGASHGQYVYSWSQPFNLDEWKYFSNEALQSAGVAADFRGKQNPTIYTNKNATQVRGEKISADVFADVGSMDTNYMKWLINELRYTNSKMIGTNYDVGLEYAYKIAYARQQQNLANGEDREIICVFMSDGAAMQYNYFSGRSQTDAWSDYLGGNTDEILTNHPYSWIKPDDITLANVESLPPAMKHMLSIFHQSLKSGGLLNVNGVKYTACTCASGSYKNENDWAATFFHCLGQREKSEAVDWRLVLRLHAKNNNNNNPTVFQQLQSSPYGIGGKGIDTRGELIEALRTPATAYATYSPYYYFYNTEGKNWWAEAIKGDASKVYPVINKYAKGQYKINGTTISNPSSYNGEEQNNYSPALAEGETKPAWWGKDYISGFKGLGLKLYTIGFALETENMITQAEAETVLKNIATSEAYAFSAGSANELNEALLKIVDNTSMGATMAYVEDQLGKDYQLWDYGKTTSYINVKKYNISGVDPNGKTIRVGDPEIIETITITHNRTTGAITSATSTLVGNNTTNILSDGVINGARVKYNTSSTETKGIDLRGDSTAEWQLKPETFFWIVGNIPEEEMVLEYSVYLTDSMTSSFTVNTKSAEYDTNNYANLNYTDVLGNLIKIELDTPTFRWGDWTEIKVVIDYGIPVDIAVKKNGVYASEFEGNINATIDAVATRKDMTFNTSSVDGKFGTLKKNTSNTNCVTYQVDDMSMTSYESFVVRLTRQVTGGIKYYFCAVYVIPATTMYYEQDFVTFTSSTFVNNVWSNPVEGGWNVPETDSSFVQADDRVGETANEYGSDNVNGGYVAMNQDSLEGSASITVTDTKVGIASFTFTGTGFDVISRTDYETGSIIVGLYKANADGSKGNLVEERFVDTYYGYKYQNNQWVADGGASDTLYQIPVMKFNGYDYGKYYVEIMVAYNKWLDHPAPGGDGQYNFYLDAIRIYDPADNGVDNKGTIVDTTDDDTFIYDAYIADGEANPIYNEVRNLLISANDFNTNTSGTGKGIVFIDNTATDGLNKNYTISDYKNYGPNNEVYLAKDQAIGFTVNPENLAELHIAMKLANGSSVKVKITAGTNVRELEIKTASDLYEDITTMLNKSGATTVVIQKVDDGTDTILSITNIKITQTASASSVSDTGSGTYLYSNHDDLIHFLAAMNADEDDNQPDQNQPDQNQPEQENPGTEINPGTGDMEMNAVVMVLMITSVMMLAVLTVANIRKKSSK